MTLIKSTIKHKFKVIKIREATKSDVDTLYNLILEIAKYHEQEKSVTTNSKEMLSSGFDKKPKFGALLAEINDEVVGYLSYTWNYSIWKGCGYMNLDDLFVINKYRGQKVGSHLMRYAQDFCVEKGIYSIRWEVQKDNLKAIEFYNGLGAKMKEKGIFRWNLKTES